MAANSSSKSTWANLSLPTFAVLVLVLIGASIVSASTKTRQMNKCQQDECQMSSEHFRLYSNIKRALERDFYIKGKDLISVIRSAELLERRFTKSNGSIKLNGSEPVLRLLADERLREALKVFTSDEGLQLVSLYRSSINGQQQNLACSKWRVAEIELAAQKLERSAQLARVFTNVHKNFIERSARKCLKTACSSIDDNMNRLDSVLRRSTRRKYFLAHDEALALEATSSTTSSAARDLAQPSASSATTTKSDLENNAIEEALIAQLENEPMNEFHLEELELCKFLKRTNSSGCRASGNELQAITFEPTKPNTNSTARNLTDYLADYKTNTSNSEATLLAQCGAIKPVLDYHLFGLRWYQRQALIAPERVRTRTFWCPSLAYWLEMDRLCNELKLALTPGGATFAY